MYTASLWSNCSGPSWVSARIQGFLGDRPHWAIMAPSLWDTTGRPFVHFLHFISQTSVGKGYLCLAFSPLLLTYVGDVEVQLILQPAWLTPVDW